MKKFMLPLLATTLALVFALLVLAPAQNAEARDPQPHEVDPDEPAAAEDEANPIHIYRPHPQVAAIVFTGMVSFLFWSILIGIGIRKAKGDSKKK